MAQHPGRDTATADHYPLGTIERLNRMTYTYLSDDQAARSEALDVAHRLMAGQTTMGPLGLGSFRGLLDTDLVHAVRLAEYVLTGKYTATLEEREQLAGSAPSTLADAQEAQLEDSTAGASVYLDRAEQADPDATTARHEREDAEARRDDPVSTEDRLRAALDSAAAQTHRARRAEAERDAWKAKYAALRADVEYQRDDLTPISGQPYTAILDRDDARDPQADPDAMAGASAYLDRDDERGEA